ncbi:hypothetical protein B0O99DRAFT_676542 [Bisporella sp. PMI_857]|nr:hypothetical protein B0O99DRAFT_676542 [Bisporella sp. PMI_857]
MAPGQDESTSTPTNKLPWLLFLEEEINASEGPVARDIGAILRSFLLSPSESTAMDTARLVNASYWEKLLLSDPLIRFQDDKGMGGFLNCLWELVFDIARRVSYNDPTQDYFIQFILELRKPLPKHFKIWEVNFSAFVACCTASGLNNQYSDPCLYPSRDIPIGLEEEMPQGLNRDCKIMVATQYILLAGTAIYEEFIGKSAEGSSLRKWGLKKWPIWTRRLNELTLEYEESGNTELAAMTREAYEKLISFSV